MEKIILHDKEFVLSITPAQIQDAVSSIAAGISSDHKDDNPLFLSILNGSFMFTADLLKKINFSCTVSFLKLASYSGDASTGIVKELIGLDEEISGRTVVVLEDIVDTGTTLKSIVAQLKRQNPGQVKIATLLLKPDAFSGDVHIDYVGLEIPNDFIVGYGLDYNQLGRNLDGIYKILPDKAGQPG